MDRSTSSLEVCPPSRRDILAGLAGLGVSALFAGSKAKAQTASGPRRFDLHHHFGSPGWLRVVAEKKMSGYQTWQPYSPAKALEDMDKGGVAMSFLSVTTPGIWFGAAEETRKLARELNEYGAKMVSDYPGRFGLFAVLPLPDANASLKEIEYAFDTLKADGVGLMSSYSNRWHGDPAFAEVFHELNRRKTVVYTHAQVPDCCQNLIPGVSDITIEYNTDTARTIVSMIDSGRALECPDIKFIYSHAGGTILALPGRFLGQQATAASPGETGGSEVETRTASPILLRHRRVHEPDPDRGAQAAGIRPRRSSLERTFHLAAARISPPGLQENGLFNEDELRAIDHDNAYKILPKYKS